MFGPRREEVIRRKNMYNNEVNNFSSSPRIRYGD
jgi:hypothetical protein